MKIILPIIFSFLFISILKAQPVLDEGPTPISNTRINYVFKKDGSLNPGPGGADQEWDFSDILYSDTLTNIIAYPSTSSFFDFPNASFAEETDEGNFIYYELDNTQKKIIGFRDNVWDKTHIYADPIILIRYPIDYNATAQTDDFEYTDYLNNLDTYKGTITTIYDGYGTITTSYGTTENVVRIKTTESGTKEWDFEGSHFTDNYTNITYTWYIPGTYIPVFEIKEKTNISYNGPVSVEKFAYLYGETPLPNSTRPRTTPELKITLGPNPASEKISLDFKDVESGNYDISITDYQGVAIMNEQKFIGNGDLHSLDISTFKSGFYIVKISSDKAEFVKKLIKY